MKRLVKIYSLLILFMCLHCQNSIGENLDSCASVESCIKRIYEVAESPESRYLDVSNKEWAVAHKLSTFGEKAVDQLIPLLKDPNENVAQIAAAALRDASHIDEKYLSAIIAALDSDYDLGWLPPALGRIDSDAAANEAVKRYIGSKSAPENQQAYAVKLCGKRAVPFIAQAAICTTPCGPKDHYELGAVLAEMDGDARNEAAKLILAYLKKPAASTESLKGLIYLLSNLKESAHVAEPQLLKLRRLHPELMDVIEVALIGMKSPQAAEAFANQLRIKPDAYVLRDLAEMGPAGRSAGSVVVGLMDHESWDIRVAVALTVGYIGYPEAVPKLIEQLNDPSNLTLNWAAAESLGRLRDSAAAPALKHVADQHWFPPARSAAQKALRNFKLGKEYPVGDENTPISRSFFGHWQEEIEACEKIELRPVDEDKSAKLYKRYAEKRLKELAFPSEVLSYGAADEEDQRAADPDAIVEVREDNIVEHREPITQIPAVALRAANGWLAGSNRGEWGGELTFIAEGKPPVILLRENVEDIYKLGDRYVAVTGLAHMGLSSGLIYELIQVGDRWSARPWRALPGAPSASWLVETGGLLVNTYGGGSVLISRDGSMRMAECI